ncbi:MAG: ParB/RepB/Spo0J family partition protein [Clostridiales bacterium]|nr:ParB/RepB/Spo0J family partition protein [Clostridiales bacterium]
MLTPREIFSKNTKQIKYIKTREIQKNTWQPRTVFEEKGIRELAASIRQYGILNPLTVRQTSSGYELIAGERRLRAAAMVGLTEVPCIMLKVNDKDSAFLALVENLQRKDLDFFEEAIGISNLIKNFGLTQEEAAEKIGKTQSAVANKLRLLKHSPEIIQVIKENDLTERHARALLRIEEEEEKKRVLSHIIKNKLNVIQSEEYIEQIINTQTAKQNKRQKLTFAVMKDVRLFLNTVNKAVSMMQRSGIDACCEKTESEGKLILKIQISSTKA